MNPKASSRTYMTFYSNNEEQINQVYSDFKSIIKKYKKPYMGLFCETYLPDLIFQTGYVGSFLNNNFTRDKAAREYYDVILDKDDEGILEGDYFYFRMEVGDDFASAPGLFAAIFKRYYPDMKISYMSVAEVGGIVASYYDETGKFYFVYKRNPFTEISFLYADPPEKIIWDKKDRFKHAADEDIDEYWPEPQKYGIFAEKG